MTNRKFPRHQNGLTSVEVAIVGLVFFVILFGVIETGRVFYVLNSLDEVTRRGARVAAVCQVNDPAIAQIAIGNPSGDSSLSKLVPGLSVNDVQVNYLNEVGGIVTDPSPSGDFYDVRYVQVTVPNFQHQLIIPTFFTTFTLPDFRTTLPRESLGVSRDGFTPC